MGRAFECRRRAKESRWATMSKIFPKLSRSITLAAKAGGPDPESNASLRVAIQNAKAANLSKENIENAIKRAAGHDASEITEVTYEAKGPHGSLFYIECATDNTNRSVGNLKVILGKNGGEIVPSGALNFMFNRKTVIEFPVPQGRDLEELEIGDYTSFNSLNSAVEGMGIAVSKSGLQRLPTHPIELTESQIQDVEALLDKIEDDDDVQDVYTNLG
jgi:YebC/PmpR family DNA-binding regulatory protein